MKVILCGKSGSGKNLAERYLVDGLGFDRAVSHTTRPRREGEEDGIDYYFVNNYIFNNTIMAESRQYNTVYQGEKQLWQYGISVVELEDDVENMVMITDLEGVESLKEYYGKSFAEEFVVIYIYRDRELREQGSIARGSHCIEEFNRRCEADDKDFEQGRVILCCDYFVENNSDEYTLYNKLREIIDGELE